MHGAAWGIEHGPIAAHSGEAGAGESKQQEGKGKWEVEVGGGETAQGCRGGRHKQGEYVPPLLALLQWWW